MIILSDATDNHYYKIFAYRTTGKTTAPSKIKQFNIYDDAVAYYNELTDNFGYVEMFEYIDGKRKYIAKSDETKKL